MLEDGRFNPFEPGDTRMTRTFKRGPGGKMSAFNTENPFQRSYTVNEYIPTLLFQSQNDVFVDNETVMRLTFMTILKAMNTMVSAALLLPSQL